MEDDDEDAASGLDEALLRTVAARLGKLTLVERVSVFPATRPESIVARFDLRYYPERIDLAALELRAYLDGTFYVTRTGRSGTGSRGCAGGTDTRTPTVPVITSTARPRHGPRMPSIGTTPPTSSR